MRKGVLSYEEVRERAYRAGPVEVLGTTWSGHELYAIQCGGDRGPSVLITAGAHGAEFAAVTAVLDMIGRLKTDRKVFVVPARDPIAVDGYAAALSAAAGVTIEVSDLDGVVGALADHGEIVHQERDLVVGLIGETGFAYSPPTDLDRSGRSVKGAGFERILDRLVELIRDGREVYARLRSRRVILPGNFFFDGTGPLDHVHTVIQRDSSWSVFPGFKDLHTLFGFPNPPVEIRALKDFIERETPATIFDCHSGYGNEFYMYSAHVEPGDTVRRDVALACASAVRDAGYPLVSESTFEQQTRDFASRFRHLGPGVASQFYYGRHATLINQFENYGQTYGLEPPLSASFEAIGAMLAAAVQGGLDATPTGSAAP